MPAGARLIYKALSHSKSYGHLSLKGKVLWPLLFANADDQGRLGAEPDEIKWQVCPNVEEITKDEIPALLDAMQKETLIAIFGASTISAIQILRWWTYQKPQWAYPSKYPAPNGWKDHHRYKKGGRIVLMNWPPEDMAEPPGELSGEGSGICSGEGSPEQIPMKGGAAETEKVLTLYEKNIEHLTPLLREQLVEALKKYPAVWVEDAIREAISAGEKAKNWRYISSILEAWRTKGRNLRHSKE